MSPCKAPPVPRADRAEPGEIRGMARCGARSPACAATRGGVARVANSPSGRRSIRATDLAPGGERMERPKPSPLWLAVTVLWAGVGVAQSAARPAPEFWDPMV